MDSKQGGFTLVELMVVVAIAAILIGIAVPNLSGALTAAKRRETSLQLYSAFQRARSEAIASNGSVVVCPLATDSMTSCAGSAATTLPDGWMVARINNANAIQEVYQTFAPKTSKIALSGYATNVVFDGRGQANTTAAITITGGGATRCLSVGRSGRVRLREVTADTPCA